MSDVTDSSGLSSWGTTDPSAPYPGSSSWDNSTGNFASWGKEDSPDFPGSQDWGYTTGGWQDPNSAQYTPPEDVSGSSTGGDFWNRAKRVLLGMGLNGIGNQLGVPGQVLNGVAAGIGAPEGKRLDTGGAAFGSSVINGLIGAIPGVGIINGLSGLFGGPTLGAYLANNRNNISPEGGAPTGGNGFEQALGGLASLYNYNRGSSSINNQIKGIEGLFGQNSPYAQTLREQLSRRDASSGRRSQYGPREVELQAKLAQLAAGQSGNLNNSYQQKQGLQDRGLNSLMQFGRQSGLFNKIGKGLGGIFQSQYTPDPLFEQTGPDF